MVALDTHGSLFKGIVFFILSIVVDLVNKSFAEYHKKVHPLKILDPIFNLVSIPPF